MASTTAIEVGERIASGLFMPTHIAAAVPALDLDGPRGFAVFSPQLSQSAERLCSPGGKKIHQSDNRRSTHTGDRAADCRGFGVDERGTVLAVTSLAT